MESDERSAAKGLSCKYCGKAWPSNVSLAQHVRNKHMAESQVDRVKELAEPPSRAGAANWTEEKRQVFLRTADEYGWDDHVMLSRRTGYSIRQVTNFKLKFPKSRWRLRGKGRVPNSPTLTNTRSPGSSCPSSDKSDSDGQPATPSQTDKTPPRSSQSDSVSESSGEESSMDENGSQGDSYTRFSGEDPPSQQAGQSLDAVSNSSQTDPPPVVGNRRSIDAGTQTDPVELSTQEEVDTGFSSSPTPDSEGQAGGHSQSADSGRSQSDTDQSPTEQETGKVDSAQSTRPTEKRPSRKRRRRRRKRAQPSGGQAAGADTQPSADLDKSDSPRSGRRKRGRKRAQPQQGQAASANPQPSGASEESDSTRSRRRRRRRRRGKNGGRNGPPENTTQSDAMPQSQSTGRRDGRSQIPSRVPNPGRNQSSGTSPDVETSRPPARHWLTLAHEEVSDEFRKELNDFVDSSLKELESAFEWSKFEQVVQELVDKVVSKCEVHMDNQTTSRPVRPTQGFRWRQRGRQGQSTTQTEESASQGQGSPAEQEQSRAENSVRSGGGNHNARARRRKAARQGYDRFEAQRLQRLFRRNRKACVREILEGGKGRRCKIPVDRLTPYFQEEYSEKSIDIDNPPDWLTDCLKAPDNPPEWDSTPIQSEEVRAQLARMPSSSSPGPDRLPYKVWKVVDPNGSLLAKIFEICRRRRKIPSAWKKSTTVLIYKKGDEGIPSNWRPISLQNAVYKLYAALWAKRLAGWAAKAGAISPTQKGFVPGEGCLEHSFLLRSLLEDARRRRRSLHLVWFDLRNAFGSIPHQLLWFTMERLGLPPEMINIFQDIYQGSSFKVSNEVGQTEDIPQNRGVKQGCPLSPLIFNLAIEGLLRGVATASCSGYDFTDSLELRSLAYADDLVIAASSEEDIRCMIDRIEEFTTFAGILFNVGKCASLSTTYRRGKRVVLQTEFTLTGTPIPAMRWEDHYKYLGVLLGPDPEACIGGLETEFKESTEKLFQSPLADWMKLEAFKEFVMPKLDYVLRSTLAHRKWAMKLDRFVRTTVKRSLGLPSRATDAFFYVPTSKGGLGLRSIEDELGNQMVTQCIKMLSSPDDFVKGVAAASLDATVLKRYGQTEGPEDRWRFLSAQLKAPQESRKTNDISTIFSRVRTFAKDLGVRLHGGVGAYKSPESVSVGDESLPEQFRKVLLRALRNVRADTWLKKWTGLVEQGAYAPSFSKVSESNYWIRDCRYLRYREFRFALKARLNLLPVAAQKIKYGKGGSTTCKGCTGNVETQEHCLSVCTGNMQEMRKRHNAIVERLVKAVPQTLGTKFLDQTVPGCDSLGRPDVVILDDKDKKAYLVDVAVPCETPENLKASRARKLDKYAGIKAKLEEKGYDTVLDALLVGSLGTWDRENDPLLGKLGIGRKYQTLFKKLCCRDAIAGSYAVWTHRCRRHFCRSAQGST